MPEEYEGQHLQTSKSLCNPAHSDMKDLIPLILYLSSNNMSFNMNDYHIIDGMDRFHWNVGELIEEDQLIMGVLRLCGLDNMEVMMHLLSLNEVTAQAITERLFAAAVRTESLEVIEAMLQAGIDTEMTFPGGFDEAAYQEMYVTALEFVAAHYSPKDFLKIARLFSLHNASLGQSGRESSALELAVMRHNEELVRFLVERESRISSELVKCCLNRAGNFAIARICLDLCDEINESMEFGYYQQGIRRWCSNIDPQGHCTLLGVVAMQGNTTKATMMVQHLLTRGANVDALQDLPQVGNVGTFDLAQVPFVTALGIAAADGDVPLMTIIIEAGAKVGREGSYIPYCLPPLALALFFDYRDAAELLVDWGASAENIDSFCRPREGAKSLFRQALARKNFWLCRFLLRNGYKVGEKEALANFYSADLRAMIRANDAESIQKLLQNHLLGEDSLCWISYGLVAAIDRGNCHIISLLLEARAAPDFRLIFSIGNLETAVYLDQIGLLQKLLQTNGQWILTTAIMSEKEMLVEILLQRWADYSSNSPPANTSQLGTLVKLDGGPRSFYDSEDVCYKDFVRPGRLCTTPLEAALCRGNFRLAGTLLVRGAIVKESEINALVWNAIKSDDLSRTIEFLNEVCAIQDLPTAPTAISMAISGNKVLLHLLLDSGLGVVGNPYEFSNVDPFILSKDGSENYFMMTGRDDLMMTGRDDLLMAGWWNWSHMEAPRTRCGIESKKSSISILEKAVSKSDEYSFRALLRLGVWTPEELGQALAESLEHGRKEYTSVLVKYGARLDGRGLQQTYLNLQINRTDVQSVKYLISAGCRLDYIFGSKMSSLQTAIIHQDIALVKILLAAGDVVKKVPEILKFAVERENEVIVEMLIAAGADVNDTKSLGYTSLHIAVKIKNPNLVQRLLDAGANVNGEPGLRQNNTPFQLAVMLGHHDIMKMLFLAGADINKPARVDGRTALHIAVSTKDIPLLKWLIGIGADVNVSLGFSYEATPFQLAVQEGHHEIMKLLRLAGADVNGPATSGQQTALQFAVKKEDIQLTQWLIEIGADVNGAAGPSSGRTALQYAVLQGNLELVDILLENGANVNQSPADGSGATALQFAAIQGYIGIAQKLIDRGANINATRGRLYGRTALEGAAEHGRIDMLQLLLSGGVFGESEGRREVIRAVKLAVKNGRHAASRFLKTSIGWNDSDIECYKQELFDYEE
jgi:ankyrin repeat protein